MWKSATLRARDRRGRLNREKKELFAEVSSRDTEVADADEAAGAEEAAALLSVDFW